MSDELVAALRAGAPYLRDVRQLPMCAILFEEAADEIDRLRAELAQALRERSEAYEGMKVYELEG